MARGEHRSAPGAVRQQRLLHHSRQQGHQQKTSGNHQNPRLHSAGEGNFHTAARITSLFPAFGFSGVREGRLPHVLGGEAGGPDLQGVHHQH